MRNGHRIPTRWTSIFKAWIKSAHMTQVRGFFERALASDPGNVEALVSAAFVDSYRATILYVDDRVALLAAAEATLTKALSLVALHGGFDFLSVT